MSFTERERKGYMDYIKGQNNSLASIIEVSEMVNGPSTATIYRWFEKVAETGSYLASPNIS